MSFAIKIKPFFLYFISEILDMLTRGLGKPVLSRREKLDNEQISNLIPLCWSANPDSRPSLDIVKKVVDQARKDLYDFALFFQYRFSILDLNVAFSALFPC